MEPDALAGIDCLSGVDQQTRMGLINYAVNALTRNNSALVYIDGGHSGWVSVETMAKRLQMSGINIADGFALNVSNYVTTSNNITYGTSLSNKLNDKHFIIDTSRNGNGPAPDGQWCNPSGRALGNKPTTNTGNVLVDAYLWIKPAGDSDGNCGGGPSAGTFWVDYAVGLAERSN